MTRHLALSFRFLGDAYHGQTDQGERAEWPPSPFRVFQALVAGNARGGGLPSRLREALRWLETLPPPMIVAPPRREGASVLTYVLNNTSDTNPTSRAPKTIRPIRLNGDRLVEYLWLMGDASAAEVDHARVLADAARHVNALGWGIDLAIGHGRVSEGLPANPAAGEDARVIHRPQANGRGAEQDLRVPTSGTLVSLERAYEDFTQRYATPGVTRFESARPIYLPWGYATGQHRPSLALRLLDEQGEPTRVGTRNLAALVGMVRGVFNDDQQPFKQALGEEVVERDLLGHGDVSAATRVSILPLPTVRDGPTDGSVRRLLLAEPVGSDGLLCRRLGELLDGVRLKPEPGDSRMRPLMLEVIHSEASDKVLSCYRRAAEAWVSVTPVLLPGYDKHKQHRGDQTRRLERARALLLKALEQAGVQATAREVSLSKLPWVTGARHVDTYQPRQKLRHYPRYHVSLRLDRATPGPLALGAGRHAGFGVFTNLTRD